MSYSHTSLGSALIVDGHDSDRRRRLMERLTPELTTLLEASDCATALTHLQYQRVTWILMVPEHWSLDLIRPLQQLCQQSPESHLILLIEDPAEHIPLGLLTALARLGITQYCLYSEVTTAGLVACHQTGLCQKLQQRCHYLAQQNQALERQQQLMRVQNDQIRETARLKSEFLSMMSHELRTPMNAVMGFAQVLLKQTRGPLTDTQVDMVQRILANSRQLLAQLNDILDLSRLEAGRLALKPNLFDLADLAASVIQELYTTAAQKELNLHLNVALVQTDVRQDQQRIRQILTNLIANAIKFTERGEILVLLHEVDPDVIEIVVHDTGIGILPEQLPHIFEAFRQADQTGTRRHKGTGLGLAIVQALVGLMQGQISVATQHGVGSTFQVQFPRHASSEWVAV